MEGDDFRLLVCENEERLQGVGLPGVFAGRLG